MSKIETIDGGLDTFLEDLQQFRQARERLVKIFQDLDQIDDGDFSASSEEREAAGRLSAELSVFSTICNQDAVLLRKQAEALGLLGKALLLSLTEVVTFYPEQGVAESWQDIEFWAVASPQLQKMSDEN